MTTHYSDPQREWVMRAIKTCTDAERQLSQYHSELKKDVEECLHLYNKARRRNDMTKEIDKPTVTLAGFNVDADVLNRHEIEKREDLTPEVIASAYAQISRSIDPVGKLRRLAAENVAKARKLSEKIVFEYGHNSIAEHAILNFDITNVSRLAIEAIEHSRLCSYTEKSQRYTKFGNGDEFHIPKEIVDLGIKNEFIEFTRKTHKAYNFILERIKDQPRPQGGKPQEDARYVTTLASTGQLGMTCNARNLENLIVRLVSHPLEEVRSIGKQLHTNAKGIIPSLIRDSKVSSYRLKAHSPIEMFSEHTSTNTDHKEPQSRNHVTLLSSEEDLFALAAFMYKNSNLNFMQHLEYLEGKSISELRKYVKDILEYMEVHDAAPRSFELPSLLFEVVISASCFAQLKRHRMATILPQEYNSSLGFVVPESIKKDDESMKSFIGIMNASKLLYDKLPKCASSAYVLTQANKRRVLVKMNARELYAFSRLREDKHAQWEIQKMAKCMMNLARSVLPLIMILACGKESFPKVRRSIYNVTDME